ncbi:oligosaccharide repeat unit polymerase [Pseudoalteromonas sp.]|uniref:oligosaccharide repeat unit polymerase n=1 Tax=Pseudoalteromonas sp. TaxID=53249 RepID=UPI001BCB7B64|nr:oligosaccharide repeat unit polymerase [Pseudoalteromonas sp.]
MLQFFFPFIVFLTLLVLVIAKDKFYSNSVFLISIYFIGLLSSVALSFLNDKYAYFLDVYYLGSVFFTLAILILLSPFIIVNSENFSTLVIPDRNILDKISIILILLSFFSFFNFIPVIYQVLNTENLSQFRYLLTAEGHPYINEGLINTLAGVVATFFIIPLTLSFVYICINYRPLLSILLLISSLSYPVFVFSYFGRDGVVFWGLAVVFNLILFRKFIPPIKLLKIKRLLLVLIFVFIVVFIFISYHRFGDLGSVLLSILDYLGQQFINFSTSVDLDTEFRNGSRSFPLFYELFSNSENSSLLRQQYSSQLYNNGFEYISWSWGTLLLDFYQDFSLWGVFFIVSLMSMTFVLLLRRGFSNINFFSLLFYVGYCQILIQGYFYFRQYNNVGNLYIIIILLIGILGRIKLPTCLSSEKIRAEY